MEKFDITMLAPASHVHMIGIGGISMSALAHILLSCGHTVSGSDVTASLLTDKLKQQGATIYIGHSKDNIKKPDLVLRDVRGAATAQSVH